MARIRTPRRALLPAIIALAALGVGSPAAHGGPRAAIDIPFEQLTLPNGLRVVVHTDRKAPLVAVNVWYHIGAKNEPRGRSGFAHLFEHLMFQGSEHLRAEYFGQLELIGATGADGTTSSDRTNYFANVPTTTLSDMVLYQRPDDHPRQRATRVETIRVDEITAAMRAIQPAALTWIVVGDLQKIEAPLRALQLGDLKVVDPDGRVLR